MSHIQNDKHIDYLNDYKPVEEKCPNPYGLNWHRDKVYDKKTGYCFACYTRFQLGGKSLMKSMTYEDQN